MELTAAQIENVRQALKQVAGEFQRAFDRGIIKEIQQENESHFIDSKTVQDPNSWKREDNLKRGEIPCIICGRGIKEDKQKYFVHYLNDGRFTDLDSFEMGELSQGYYPVGAECKNKFPKNFITAPENIK